MPTATPRRSSSPPRRASATRRSRRSAKETTWASSLAVDFDAPRADGAIPRELLERFENFAGLVSTVEGSPLEIEPFQRRILLAYFSGYPEVLILIPKGNGKTTLLAALAVFHLLTTRYPEAYIGASTKEQADKMYREAIRIAGYWPSKLRALPGYREIRLGRNPSAGFLKVLASDKLEKGSVEGLAPTLGLVDELHAHANDAIYAAIQGGLEKRGGQMLTISTAGNDHESTLARIRKAALAYPEVVTDDRLKIARSPDGGFVMFEWACRDGDDLADFEVLKRANPASFVTGKALKRLRNSPSMTAERWARYHANLWVEGGDECWIDPATWHGAAEPGLAIPKGSSIYLGVDLAHKHDTTALVPVWRRPDESTVTAGARFFDADGDDPIDLPRVRDAIADYCRDYRVVLVYDPWGGAEYMAQDLEREFGILTVAHPCGPERMSRASALLYQDLGGGDLVHDGNPILTNHALAAVPRSTERAWRIAKKKNGAHIDGLVALAMANAVGHADDTTSVYEDRGLVSLDEYFEDDDEE